jgi:hypothetical protein
MKKLNSRRVGYGTREARSPCCWILDLPPSCLMLIALCPHTPQACERADEMTLEGDVRRAKWLTCINFILALFCCVFMVVRNNRLERENHSLMRTNYELNHALIEVTDGLNKRVIEVLLCDGR